MGTITDRPADVSAHCCLLTDNGSLRPAATVSLRALAAGLGEAVGATVHPVSLLHSHKIDPAELGGVPAETFERFVLSKRADGIGCFLVTPLFFGPSAAITEYLPQRVDALREEHGWPELEVRVAPPVVDAARPEDTRMAEIMADLVAGTIASARLGRPAVALCDHGAPRAGVTEVRDLVAAQLRGVLGDRCAGLSPCSMERREGDAYAFNDPLLENLLGSPGFDRAVVVAMLFFQPGRHAGAAGDVATLCRAAESRCPSLRCFMTELVGTHPNLIPILAERFFQGLGSKPVGEGPGRAGP